jgi:MFS family permease
MAGTFMFVLDFFIVNVAIPATQRDLHASAGEIQLIVATYAIALASGLIVGGRLGDLFGRRRVFMAGLALFTAASAVCGEAQNATVLIAGRIAQGLGAALFWPQVLSIIGVTYDGEEREKAITLYGLVLGLGAVSGQLIGGLLIHFDLLGLDWRSCYLVNVPIGIVSLAFAPRVLAESRAEHGDRLDIGGRGAGHRCARRGRPSARRGTPGGLARVDLGDAGGLGPTARRLRRPAAAARGSWRVTAL